MNFFEEYIKKYDMNNPKIYYKYYHSFRVMDNMEILAKCQSLPTSDVNLAKCIGLLHDIGWFDQAKLYHNFSGKEMDHGDYGVEILKKENILSHFDIAKEDYEVVYKAIKNHSKFIIDNNLNHKELLFTKLIRDADKLDIIYALGNETIKPNIIEDNLPISEAVKKTFYNHQSIERNETQNKNDKIITVFGYIYDINYLVTLKIINKYKYYDLFYQRLKNKDIFKPYYDYVNSYIKERID